MMATDHLNRIFIIDDDASVRRSLTLLLTSYGYDVESFQNAEEFVGVHDYTGAGCIILDIYMEGRTGLELQEEIGLKYKTLLVIYLTGQGSIPMSVQAMKKGAFNFLQKPVDDQVLLGSVNDALKQSHDMIKINQEISRLKSLIDELTPREFKVFEMVIKGMLNKQIAGNLNIAEHTVKLHRGKITEKLGVKSTAELVRLAHMLGLI